MNVVFCVDGVFPYTIGGMQRHSRLLVETLAESGECNITVIHPHKNILIFPKNFGIEEISLDGINYNNNYLLECYRYSKRVYSELLALPSGTIIYSQGLSVWYKSREFSNRLIVNPHGLEPFQAISLKDKLVAIPFKIIFKYIFENSKLVISLGGHLTKILRKIIPSEKIAVIPNAVQLPNEYTGSNSRGRNDITTFLFVARFAHNKGIHILMQAIVELNKEGMAEKLNFVLVGNGPLYDKYIENNKEKNVIFKGFISDAELLKLYVDSDIYIFPTLFEGMPTVVLEAMAHGLPIIVSDTGATSDLVDNSNGYLIKKNSVFALKKAIREFVCLTQNKKDRLAKKSKEKVKNSFTWEMVSEKHMNIFNNVDDSLQ